MILELATFTIPAAKLQEFEAAYVAARKVITQAEGCGAVSLHRCIETPGRYQLLVEWPTVEHHMKGFRKSQFLQRSMQQEYFHLGRPDTRSLYRAPFQQLQSRLPVSDLQRDHFDLAGCILEAP